MRALIIVLVTCLVFSAMGGNSEAQTFPGPVKALNTNAATDGGQDYLPNLKTDGNGTWICVWSSNEAGIGDSGSDDDIAIARSTDNGQSWSSPSLLNTNDVTGGAAGDVNPVLATDTQGVWVTAWISNDDLNGTTGFDQDVLFSRSMDNGVSWSAPVLVNLYGTNDIEFETDPAIATDGSGDWVIAWASEIDLAGAAGSDYDILFACSSDNGASWGSAGLLNTNAEGDTGDDRNPRIAVDPVGGTLIAAWNSNENLGGDAGSDQDIFFARSTDGGMTWSVPALIDSNDTAAAGFSDSMFPDIAADGEGNWVAVWQSTGGSGSEYDFGSDSDLLVAASIDDGESWSLPMLLNAGGDTDLVEDQHPRVVTDGAGTWVAGWYSYPEGTVAGAVSDVFFAVSDDNGGTWSTPIPAHSNGAVDSGHVQNFIMAMDGQGKVVAAWDSFGDLDVSPSPGNDGDIFTVAGSFAPTSSGATDINGDFSVDAVDVQLVINGALGIAVPVNMDTDVDGSGATNAVDVQLVVNAALGITAL